MTHDYRIVLLLDIERQPGSLDGAEPIFTEELSSLLATVDACVDTTDINYANEDDSGNSDDDVDGDDENDDDDDEAGSS